MRSIYAIIFIISQIGQVVAVPPSSTVAEQSDQLANTYSGLIGDNKQNVDGGWIPKGIQPTRAIRTANPYEVLAEGTETEVEEKPTCEIEECPFPKMVHDRGDCDKNICIMMSADWCTVCKPMYPIVTELRKEGYLIYVVDVEKPDFKKFEKQYKIRAYPTFIIFDNGVEVKRTTGMKTKQWFKKNLRTYNE